MRAMLWTSPISFLAKLGKQPCHPGQFRSECRSIDSVAQQIALWQDKVSVDVLALALFA